MIHSVVSHGYGITVGCGTTIDVAPEHEMEKVLFAADELTGLIWAAALMRPSKSTKDMELKSLKKKYKSKGFAAGCSREVKNGQEEDLLRSVDYLSQSPFVIDWDNENSTTINSAFYIIPIKYPDKFKRMGVFRYTSLTPAEDWW